MPRRSGLSPGPLDVMQLELTQAFQRAEGLEPVLHQSFNIISEWYAATGELVKTGIRHKSRRLYSQWREDLRFASRPAA